MGSRRSEITDHPTETHKWTITEIEFLSNLFNQNLSIEFIEQLKNSFLREGKCPSVVL